MRVAILAGGLGTRLQEETTVKPKPMVEIGGRPILWHVMKHYSHHGFNEFIVALGYKGECIKRHFLDYHSLNSNITVDLATGQITNHNQQPEPWLVHLVDTGGETNTGGRVKRLQRWLDAGTFMVTYGDGVADVNLRELLEFHYESRAVATVTAVRPPARFGGLLFDGRLVRQFTEKPQAGEGWINGGFMVCEPKIFDYLDSDACSLEIAALERLAAEGKLAAFRHDRFWQCMDTLRDKRQLEALWEQKAAPWKVWQ
ncbi:MAG TPA: glucose-1-phosphate cytidylyltransferase [Pirellulales bacterium]|jgi:glucose-1-phosphate cytidylyltransferase|nr:glucose-1-phosphate cytidylyltransferase [Pirellulales bacterium]